MPRVAADKPDKVTKFQIPDRIWSADNNNSLIWALLSLALLAEIEKMITIEFFMVKKKLLR